MPVEAVRWGDPVRIVGGDEAVVEPPRGVGDLAVEGSQRTLAMEEDDGVPRPEQVLGARGAAGSAAEVVDEPHRGSLQRRGGAARGHERDWGIDAHALQESLEAFHAGRERRILGERREERVRLLGGVETSHPRPHASRAPVVRPEVKRSAFFPVDFGLARSSTPGRASY